MQIFLFFTPKKMNCVKERARSQTHPEISQEGMEKYINGIQWTRPDEVARLPVTEGGEERDPHLRKTQVSQETLRTRNEEQRTNVFHADIGQKADYMTLCLRGKLLFVSRRSKNRF